MTFENVKALTFDVFGTVVDWRGTLIRETERLVVGMELRPDWVHDKVAKWARLYGDYARMGEYRPLDTILREIGRQILEESSLLDRLDGEKVDHYLNVWERLDPWPDSLEGLQRLRSRFRVATLSNANLAMQIRMNNGLPWDRLMAPDSVEVYKPHPRLYCHGLQTLGLPGHQVMMVAAHLFDLEAAKRMGYRTAFIRRPHEDAGDPGRVDYVDLIADDLIDLSRQLCGPDGSL